LVGTFEEVAPKILGVWPIRRRSPGLLLLTEVGSRCVRSR
jgi:hypothetical protein